MTEVLVARVEKRILTETEDCLELQLQIRQESGEIDLLEPQDIHLPFLIETGVSDETKNVSGAAEVASAPSAAAPSAAPEEANAPKDDKGQEAAAMEVDSGVPQDEVIDGGEQRQPLFAAFVGPAQGPEPKPVLAAPEKPDEAKSEEVVLDHKTADQMQQISSGDQEISTAEDVTMADASQQDEQADASQQENQKTVELAQQISDMLRVPMMIAMQMAAVQLSAEQQPALSASPGATLNPQQPAPARPAPVEQPAAEIIEKSEKPSASAEPSAVVVVSESVNASAASDVAVASAADQPTQPVLAATAPDVGVEDKNSPVIEAAPTKSRKTVSPSLDAAGGPETEVLEAQQTGPGPLNTGVDPALLAQQQAELAEQWEKYVGYDANKITTDRDGDRHLEHGVLGNITYIDTIDMDKEIRRQMNALKAALRKQMGHYFSEESLKKEAFLYKNMSREGWVHVSVPMTFNRMMVLLRGFTATENFVLHCLEMHEVIEVDSVARCVRRRMDLAPVNKGEEEGGGKKGKGKKKGGRGKR